MQTAKYINPRGEEIRFGFAPPYIFEKIDGVGAEDAALITTESAGVDGTTFHGLRFGDREITLTIHVWGRTRAEMYANRQALIAKLCSEQSRTGALGRFYYSNDHMAVWIPALVRKAPQKFARSGNYQKSVQIVFYCPSHLWRGLLPQTNRIAYMGGGMKFPLRFSSVRFGAQGYESNLYNAGDSGAPARITITGPATMPSIIKDATGEFVKVKRELFAGDVLTIDTTPNHLYVSITRANGTTEDAFGYIDLSSTFFLLDPGENKLRYESEDDSQSTVILLELYPRYGGV